MVFENLPYTDFVVSLYDRQLHICLSPGSTTSQVEEIGETPIVYVQHKSCAAAKLIVSCNTVEH